MALSAEDLEVQRLEGQTVTHNLKGQDLMKERVLVCVECFIQR